MTLEQKIYETIWKAKFYSQTLFDEIVSKENNGEDVIEIKKKFIILNKWIEMLQFYLDNNFDENGVIEPIIECLTEQQIQLLVAKVKVMIGNNKYYLDNDWILSLGYWRDQARWDDGNFWNDYVPLN